MPDSAWRRRAALERGESGDGYAIVRGLAFAPGRLDGAARSTIKTLWFDDWLESRTRAAKIEWSEETPSGYRRRSPASAGDRRTRRALGSLI